MERSEKTNSFGGKSGKKNQTSGFLHEGKEKSDSMVTDKNKNKFVNNCFKCFFNVKPFTPFKVSRKWC